MDETKSHMQLKVLEKKKKKKRVIIKTWFRLVRNKMMRN